MTIELPRSAHIEHLKNEAKALLKGCRQGETQAIKRFALHHPNYQSSKPDFSKAKLQEAQHVIACEYGAASWPCLASQLKGKKSEQASKVSGILLFTNGSHAIEQLEKAGVPGDKQEWLEVLYDGPVPLTNISDALDRIRAKHFASLGWGSEEQAYNRLQRRNSYLAHPDAYTALQIWLEHDLYDQLQLIQLLATIAENTAWRGKISLAQFTNFIGHLNSEDIASGQSRLNPVSEEQFALAQCAWTAFRHGDPKELETMLKKDLTPLPCLKAALLRLCQEYPSVSNGLGRTQQQILQALASKLKNPIEIFRFSQGAEEAPFMGDASFYNHIERLMQGAYPLVELENATSFKHPSEVGYTDTFRSQRLALTQAGQHALAGNLDWLDHLPNPYWIGGVEIKNDTSWRYDADRKAFTQNA